MIRLDQRGLVSQNLVGGWVLRDAKGLTTVSSTVGTCGLEYMKYE